MTMKKSMSIALAGLLGAIMIVTMLLGNILPLTSVLCPAIAGFCLIPARRECGRSLAIALYLAVSALSLILLPDKESALFFTLLLGLYPLCRNGLNRIATRWIRTLCKLLLCNLLLVTIYLLLLFVLVPAALAADFSNYGTVGACFLLFMGNVAFFLYDNCLGRVAFLYEYKLRGKLFRSRPH